MQTRSYFAVIFMVATAFLLGSLTNAQEVAESDSRTELNKLLTKRRDVLLQRVDILDKNLSQGLVQVDSVVMAREQLLDAELPLATTKQQRLEIYQERIVNMRKLEDSLKIRHQAGKTKLEALLSATAARLQAEIDLAREK